MREWEYGRQGKHFIRLYEELCPGLDSYVQPWLFFWGNVIIIWYLNTLTNCESELKTWAIWAEEHLGEHLVTGRGCNPEICLEKINKNKDMDVKWWHHLHNLSTGDAIMFAVMPCTKQRINLLSYPRLKIRKVYYLIPRKYSTVDLSFWSKVDSDAALLPSWFNWLRNVNMTKKLVLGGTGTKNPLILSSMH